MSDRITCPNCSNDIEITEVISAQMESEIRADFEAEFAKKSRELASHRQELESQQRQLQSKEEELERRVQKEVQAQRKQLASKLKTEAQQAVAVELEDRDEQLRQYRQQLKAAQEQELQLRKRHRQLEEREQQQQLELARKLDKERETIRAAAQKQADQESQLRLAERDQKIEALTKQAQEMQRRLEQGSQQTQGEVQEIALEKLLNEAFPEDVIKPVPKGVRGADALQHVFDQNGRECGVILWESKNTKNWSDKWLGKAIDDQQEAKASCACIVSAVLPDSIEFVDLINGVWVASWSCARSAAVAIRQGLIETAQVRRATEGQNGKMELVYSYLSGPEFRNRVRGLIEPFQEMQADLDKEKKAFTRVWNKRQKQLDRALSSTHGFYGDLQGIIGNGLQEIEGMDVLSIEAEDADDVPLTLLGQPGE